MKLLIDLDRLARVGLLRRLVDDPAMLAILDENHTCSDAQ
jgi:hypothetical protein